MSTFFGLGPNYRPVLHQEILDLIYHGNGGFTHTAVYDMPVWLRKFYIKGIIEKLKPKEQSSTPPPKIARPGI